MLRVRLVGGLSAWVAGEPLALPERRAARSLFAWLALHPGMHARAQIAAVFWPDVLDDSARASLRVALSSLRRSLGDGAEEHLVATREQVGLAENQLWVDVREITSLIESDRLADAAELGDGELLPELDDEWVYRARDQHRLRHGELLARLAERAAAQGDLSTAIAWGTRQLALDPLAEDAARNLMRRLAGHGDRVGALRVYARLQDDLRTELGLAPAPDTRELAESIRDRSAASPGGSPRHASQPPPSGIVTFLFTDLVGSTELVQRVGDDAAERLFRDHLGALGDAVAAAGGHEIKQMGDGVMAAFASPARAVACAVAMQQALARQNLSLPPETRLQMRIGIDAGDATEQAGDYWGTPIIVARRLCDAASGGEILVSGLARRLMGSRGDHEFTDGWEIRLKGLSEPVEACRVAWQERGAGQSALPPPLEAADQRRFIGRDGPLDRLQALLVDRRADGWHVALLSGEAGIGKTRLGARFARRAADAGATILFGRCYEEALTPYQPFVEALERYVADGAGASVCRQLGPHSDELSRLLPTLRGHEVNLSTPGFGDLEGERYRLFEAVASLVGRAASEAPVVLILDDIHWADHPTLLMLTHLLRSEGDGAGMIVLTCRDSELTEDHPVRRLLDELARERRLETVSLHGLDQADVSALVADWREEAPASLAEAVHRETNGNPFFVEELLRHLSERVADDVAEWPETDVLGLGIPEGLRQVIERRVAGVSREAQQLLRLAAVIGRDFEFAVLQEISELSSESLLDAIDELARARLILEDTARFGAHSFAHSLIREVLYADLTTVRRARLHQRIGEAIETLSAGDPSGRLAELAHHFLLAAPLGGREPAIEYSRRAGEQAAATFAYEKAATHFEKALELLEGTAPREDARRCDLLLAAANARVRGGQVEAGRALFREAAGQARALGDAARLAATALGHAGGLTAFGAVTVDEPAIALLEEALDGLAEEDSTLRAHVLATLAIASYYKAPLAERSRLSDEAVRMSVRLGDRATELMALTARHWATLGPDGVEERRSAAARIVELADETRDLESAFRGYLFQAGTLLELGDAAAFESVKRCEELALRLRQPSFLWEHDLQKAMRALLEGRLEETEQLAGSAAARAQELGQAPRVMNHYASLMLSARWLQHRLVELEGVVDAFAAQYPWISTWPLVPPVIAEQAGREQEARAAFDAVMEEGVERFPRDRSWLLNMAILAVLCHSVEGEPAQAADVHRLLAPFANRMVVAGGGSLCLGSVELFLGLLDERMERHDEALARYARAASKNEAMGAPAFQALADCYRAQLLGTMGAREKATDLLAAAQTRFPDLGLFSVRPGEPALTSGRGGR